MNLDKYIELVTRIINSDDISEDKKIIFLQMLDRIKNIDEDKLKILEDTAYQINNKSLSSKERIAYELNKLLSSNSNDKNLQEIIKQLAYCNIKVRKKQDLDKLKVSLSKLIISYGGIPEFYSVYETLINDALTKKDKESKEVSKDHFKNK